MKQASNPDPEVNSRLRWGANIVYSLVLVVLALIPPSSAVTNLSIPDWAAHATAYGIQAALLFWAALPSLGRFRAMIIGIVGASAFGGVTEGLQLLQPGRSVEVKDLLANTAGALVMCGIVAVVLRFGKGDEG